MNQSVGRRLGVSSSCLRRQLRRNDQNLRCVGFEWGIVAEGLGDVLDNLIPISSKRPSREARSTEKCRRRTSTSLLGSCVRTRP